MSQTTQSIMESTEELTHQLIEKSLSLPGVKVDRRDFLMHTFGGQLQDDDIPLLLKEGPVKSGLISQADLKQTASKLCDQNRIGSSIASFASGLPGGLALAATIPLDTLQFFAANLRTAQQVAYIYGYEDFWQADEDDVDEDRINNELTMLLGVMFDATGASQLTKLVASQLSRKFATDLHQKAIVKVVYAPIVKSIAKSVSVHVTKNSFSTGISKTVPIFGGFISGGVTYTTMSKMNQRLCSTFDEMYTYTGEEAEKDINTLKNNMPNAFDKNEKLVNPD